VHCQLDIVPLKAGWNPDAVARTLCAFANGFENLSGGCIVIPRTATNTVKF